MKHTPTLSALLSFPGFRARSRLQGVFGNRHPGFVEGLKNKIRVIQRRGYGYRDEEYLRLKILTAFLPQQ